MTRGYPSNAVVTMAYLSHLVTEVTMVYLSNIIVTLVFLPVPFSHRSNNGLSIQYNSDNGFLTCPI